METEELEALCVWLRQYAPGYHLQYKIAADLIEKQAARIVELEAQLYPDTAEARKRHQQALREGERLRKQGV